jgi:ribose transport system substrate-binding protein
MTGKWFGDTATRARAVRPVLVLVLFAALTVLAACGDSSDDDASQAANSSSGDLAAFEKKVSDLVAERSAKQTQGPPEEGPAAAEDKSVYVVACWQALEGCARESKTAVEAGKEIGWDVTLIDTESKPDKMNQAVQRAIDGNADGIIVQAIDMATLAAPLQQAKDAGIKIVCFACVNSNDIAEQVIPSAQSFYDDGYALAAQMYEDTDGHPRILIISNKEVGVIANRLRGTQDFVADCKAAGGDCEIVAEEFFLFADLTTRVPGLVTGALRQNPDTNAVWMAFDSTLSFVQQGVEQAGVSRDKLGLYGFDGNIPNLANMREGGWQVASMAGPFEWVGWAEIDALNRLFQGEKPVDDVVVAKLITPDNLPATDVYDGDVEFRRGYLKSWGVD